MAIQTSMVLIVLGADTHAHKQTNMHTIAGQTQFYETSHAPGLKRRLVSSFIAIILRSLKTFVLLNKLKSYI